MKSLKKERVPVMITDAINEIIATEHLGPGDKLYSENILAERLEVSRTSVREAIRMLEVTGRVKVYQGKGVFISDPIDNECPIKDWVVDNTDLLKEHFEVRLLIEPHAAAMAAARSKENSLSGLEKEYDQFCEYVNQNNISQAIRSDSAFHLDIAKLTDNRTLTVLMKTMTQTLNEGWYASLNTPGRLEKTITEHGDILAAIKKGRGTDASKLMKAHLTNALEEIKSFTHRS